MAVAGTAEPARRGRRARRARACAGWRSRPRAWRRCAAGGSRGASPTPTSRSCCATRAQLGRLAALALFDDAGRGGRRAARLEREAGRPRRETFRLCDESARRSQRGARSTSCARREARGLAPGAALERRRRAPATARDGPRPAPPRRPGDRRPVAARLGLLALPGPGGQRAPALGAAHARPARAARCARSSSACAATWDDAELAARAGHAWSALSRACHHHPYELAPTAAELRAWFAVVEDLVARTGSIPYFFSSSSRDRAAGRCRRCHPSAARRPCPGTSTSCPTAP